MGACFFCRVSYGRDAEEAYENAFEDAQCEKGYKDGYSGDLNSIPVIRCS
jgi:hypothetical protein